MIEEYRDWDTKFLDLSEHISLWSKDPSTKVGAVIVDVNRRIISTGYNGLPQNIMDSHDRLSNRKQKLETTIHAEANAILFAQQNLSGMTMYTTPFQPCSRCASLIIQSGISKVVSYDIDENNFRWKDWEESFKMSKELFEESGVELLLLEKVYRV